MQFLTQEWVAPAGAVWVLLCYGEVGGGAGCLGTSFNRHHGGSSHNPKMLGPSLRGLRALESEQQVFEFGSTILGWIV